MVKIELFSYAGSAQCNCNLATVKLELFGNISLVFDINNFEYCGKAIHQVESSSAKHNLFIIEGVESSSAEYNPPIS